MMDHPNRSICRTMALQVHYGEETGDGWYCSPAMAQDAICPDELDMVCQYILSPMHLGVPSKGQPTKTWWEDPAFLSGCFTRKELVASVLEPWADQDDSAGSHPPTWGNMHRHTRPHQQSPNFSRRCPRNISLIYALIVSMNSCKFSF